MMQASAATQTKTTEKWGEDVLTKGKGFLQVPALLLKNQHRLRTDGGTVSATEMIVLLNILLHWWNRNDVVFPKAEDIAKRIGVTRRSIDRAVAGLVKGNLLKKERQGNRVLYSPIPLAERLTTLANEPEEANNNAEH